MEANKPHSTREHCYNSTTAFWNTLIRQRMSVKQVILALVNLRVLVIYWNPGCKTLRSFSGGVLVFDKHKLLLYPACLAGLPSTGECRLAVEPTPWGAPAVVVCYLLRSFVFMPCFLSLKLGVGSKTLVVAHFGRSAWGRWLLQLLRGIALPSGGWLMTFTFISSTATTRNSSI